MWQVLIQDTSFWTCFWFLFAATLNMTVGPWKVVSIAYIYTSLEFIIASAMHNVIDPVLTLFAYKVAILIGIVFGSAIQPKATHGFSYHSFPVSHSTFTLRPCMESLHSISSHVYYVNTTNGLCTVHVYALHAYSSP